MRTPVARRTMEALAWTGAAEDLTKLGRVDMDTARSKKLMAQP